MPGHADGVPVAGKTDPGREIAGIVLGRPHSVVGHFNGRESKPLRPRGAVDVPVQPGVVHEDLQTATDQQDDEQEVDVVGDTQPGRKALGLAACQEQGARAARGQSDRGPLNVRHDNRQHKRRNQEQKCAAVGYASCCLSYGQANMGGVKGKDPLGRHGPVPSWLF